MTDFLKDEEDLERFRVSLRITKVIGLLIVI